MDDFRKQSEEQAARDREQRERNLIEGGTSTSGKMAGCRKCYGITAARSGGFETETCRKG
eukprot:11257196-Karenia_brevis.AAC.1